MNNRYELKTMQDILAIPADRMDAFLPELKAWHELANDMNDTLDALAKATGTKYTPNATMSWIDDGKTNKRVIVTIKPDEATNEPI